MADGAAVQPVLHPGDMTDGDLDRLQADLDYRFHDQALLIEALTHPSILGQRRTSDERSYQRLEFLGDRVLGLVMAEWLLQQFPDESEGQLAKRHAALVRAEALAVVARGLDLGSYLRLATGEAATGGRDKPAILADACEAVIGALYCDGGLPPARQLILARWPAVIPGALPTEPKADPKTALQEWALARALPLPVYRLVERLGSDHEPEFVIEVTIQGRPPSVGRGPSKRSAEKQAAAMLLAKLEEINS